MTDSNASFRFSDKMNFDFHSRAQTVVALDASLALMEQAELVRRLAGSEHTYFFKHALVQDTAQSTLLRGEYKRLNLLVAHAYENSYETRNSDEFVALLAQYYDAGGDDANTLMYALRAGDQAARVYANVEAIAFYTQALDAASRLAATKQGDVTTAQLVHLYTKRGRVFEVTGRDPDALATYKEMSDYARTRGDRALELQALLLCGKLYAAPSPVSDRAQALELAKEADNLAQQLGDREAQAHALWIQQLSYLYNNEIPETIRCGEQAMALARELGARELLGFIMTDLARAYLRGEQIARVPALEAEALAIWRELDDKPMLADNLMQTATRAMLRGDYDSALTLAEEGVEISRAIGSKLSLMSNQGTQLLIYLERGEFARALQLSADILREGKEMGSNFNYPMQTAFAAYIYGQLGANAPGAELAIAARLELEQPVPEFFRAWAWVMLARYALAIGDMSAARDALARSQMDTHSMAVDPAGLFGTLVLGECLLAEGEYVNVVQLMSKRVNLLRQMEFQKTLPDILLIQAQAAHALGDFVQAFELLHRARDLAKGMQARWLLWQIDALLSEMENERGNVELASAYHEEARAVLKFIVEHTPQEFRASFLNLPRVCEVLN